LYFLSSQRSKTKRRPKCSKALPENCPTGHNTTTMAHTTRSKTGSIPAKTGSTGGYPTVATVVIKKTRARKKQYVYLLFNLPLLTGGSKILLTCLLPPLEKRTYTAEQQVGRHKSGRQNIKILLIHRHPCLSVYFEAFCWVLQNYTLLSVCVSEDSTSACSQYLVFRRLCLAAVFASRQA